MGQFGSAALPLAKNTSDPVELLGQLIGFDTTNPPGREAEAADFLGARLSAADFDVRLDPVGDGRSNLVATFSNGPGPTLAFNTHFDVVPAGDGWVREPFRMSRDGGRLYGRGACDAKGPLAALASAGMDIAATPDGWSGTLMLVFVADEEVGSAGARMFAADALKNGSPRVDFAIIGEPTKNAVAIAHKGSLRPLVRVFGRSAHSSRPQDGENAIFGAAHLLAALERVAPRFATRSHPLCGNGSLTVTRILGGTADNVIPEGCDILLDRRLIPGESEPAAMAELEAIVAEASAAAGIRAGIVEWRPTTGGATATPADRPIVRHALAAAARYGIDKPPGGLNGACDLVHFNSLGAEGIVLGPGDTAQAHKPDEFVEESQLRQAVSIYRDIAGSILAT